MSMWATTVGNSREQYIAAGKNFFDILVFLMQHGLQSTQSRDLLLYAKSWQWRCVNRSANSQQNTIEALKRIFWRKNVIFRLHKNPSMIMSCYCGKTQKSPSFVIHFLEDCHERNAFRHSAKLILKKYEQGFRSGGQILLDPKWPNGKANLRVHLNGIDGKCFLVAHTMF